MAEREWRPVYEDLHTTLVAAQEERWKRQGWIQGSGTLELEWAVHELQVMTDRVNLLRARRGLPPVSMTAVASKEHLALGHIDYTTKWAIGCTDLVFAELVTSPEAGERRG